LPHLEEDLPGGVDSSSAAANAAIDGTDPGAVMDGSADSAPSVDVDQNQTSPTTAG
jgi:hypothetical protein